MNTSNEPEPLSPPYEGGNPEVGTALREFFVGLLEGRNLVSYHQDRDTYIRENVTDERAAELLMSDAFIEIERHVLAVTGSGRAKPLFVISPPY